MRHLFIAAVAFCLLAAAPQDRGKRPPQSKGPKVGDKAPDFKLKKLKDKDAKKGKDEFVKLSEVVKKEKKHLDYDNEKAWAHAKNALAKYGSFDKILERWNMTDEMKGFMTKEVEDGAHKDA